MDALSVLENICDHPRLITNRQCLDLGLEMPPGVDIDSQGAAVAQDPSMFDISHISDDLLIKESGKVVFIIGLLENLRAEHQR